MSFNIKVLPFIIWFYPPLLNNDVSLHDLVKCFIVFGAQEHKKWSPDDQNMFVFVLDVFLQFGQPRPGSRSGQGRPLLVPGQPGRVVGATTFSPPTTLSLEPLLRGLLPQWFSTSSSSLSPPLLTF